MVVVAQLVRASDCGSEGRRFETGLPPKKLILVGVGFFYMIQFGFTQEIDRFLRFEVS